MLHTMWSALVMMMSICLSVTLCTMALRVGVGVESCTAIFLFSTFYSALSIHFFRDFCSRMYRLATEHGDCIQSWQASSTEDFRHQKQTFVWNCKQVNNHADPSYSRQWSAAIYQVPYRVWSAITATAELLVSTQLTVLRQLNANR